VIFVEIREKVGGRGWFKIIWNLNLNWRGKMCDNDILLFELCEWLKWEK